MFHGTDEAGQSVFHQPGKQLDKKGVVSNFHALDEIDAQKLGILIV